MKRKTHNAGWIPGPSDKDDPPALAHTLNLLHRAARRKPTEADAPPVSTFPMSKAARAALNLRRERQ